MNEMSDIKELARALASELSEYYLQIEGDDYRQLYVERKVHLTAINELEKQLVEAKSRISKLEEAQCWIPVSERLPKDYEEVDLWCYEYGWKKFRAIGYIINEKWVIVGIEDQLLVNIVVISWRYPIALPEEGKE